MKKIFTMLFAAALAAAMALGVGCSPAASGSASSAAAESSSAASASVAASSAAASASSPIADIAPGAYTIEVTLEGGSGKASIDSPCSVKVENGIMTATLVWSSPNYDQMYIGDRQYLPVNTEGNSTFEVPVPMLDADFPIQAETTAMSEPHMIDYTLHFDSSTLQPE